MSTSFGHSADAAPGRTPSVWNVANGLTVLRLLLVPLFGWLLLRDDGSGTTDRLLATAVFLLAVVTDRLDGNIARRHNLVTNLGKIADPIADKALTGAAFIGLSLLGELGWWVTVLVLVREWGVTALRLWVIRRGVMPASRGGKTKTALQALALALYLLPGHADSSGDRSLTLLHGAAELVMAVAVAATMVTGVDYVRRALRLRAATRPAAPDLGR